MIINGRRKGKRLTNSIEASSVKRLCKTHKRITVNGMFPSPTLEARNGDTMIIKAINKSPYNATLHWHGIGQMRTTWAEGPEFVTQCPIRPCQSCMYRFTIEDQEGTLWWHAHSSSGSGPLSTGPSSSTQNLAPSILSRNPTGSFRS